MDDVDPPEARPDQVTIAVEWRDDDGALTGHVEVRNVSGTACSVSGKPALLPLDGAGAFVGVRTAVTAEFRPPGYTVLQPGRRARSRIRWAAWRGTPTSDQVIVRLRGGEQQVTVRGPSAPTRADGAQNISSSWFDLVEDGAGRD